MYKLPTNICKPILVTFGRIGTWLAWSWCVKYPNFLAFDVFFSSSSSHVFHASRPFGVVDISWNEFFS
jgi:hypothetical protein